VTHIPAESGGGAFITTQLFAGFVNTTSIVLTVDIAKKSVEMSFTRIDNPNEKLKCTIALFRETKDASAYMGRLSDMIKQPFMKQ
jgi:hypothetical protein